MANLRREIIIDNRTTVINDIFAHMNKTEDISILSVGQNSAIMYSHRTATKPQKSKRTKRQLYEKYELVRLL